MSCDGPLGRSGWEPPPLGGSGALVHPLTSGAQSVRTLISTDPHTDQTPPAASCVPEQPAVSQWLKKKKINLMQKLEEKINIKASTLYMCDSYIFLDWH